MGRKRNTVETEEEVEEDFVGVPEDVGVLRRGIRDALNTKDSEGHPVGNSQYGVYAFYDYDGEPIYVGQTKEKLRARIGRHLTNQRTDAVAMNVLDPFEVAEIEMWPLKVAGTTEDMAQLLDAAEFTVYTLVLKDSYFKAVLNEKNIAKQELVSLPQSVRVTIVPEDVLRVRKHPDTRIARRASVIASLARVISERDVSSGLRRTLATQARRLEHLAAQRFEEFSLGLDDVETATKDDSDRPKAPKRPVRVNRPKASDSRGDDPVGPTAAGGRSKR